MNKNGGVMHLIAVVLIIIAIFLALNYFKDSSSDDVIYKKTITGDVVQVEKPSSDNYDDDSIIDDVEEFINDLNPVKSSSDRCAEGYFDCIKNCPLSSLSNSHYSYRCVYACTDESCDIREEDLSKINTNRLTCIVNCYTITGTIKYDCANSCLD